MRGGHLLMLALMGLLGMMPWSNATAELKENSKWECTTCEYVGCQSTRKGELWAIPILPSGPWALKGEVVLHSDAHSMRRTAGRCIAAERKLVNYNLISMQDMGVITG